MRIGGPRREPRMAEPRGRKGRVGSWGTRVHLEGSQSLIFNNLTLHNYTTQFITMQHSSTFSACHGSFFSVLQLHCGGPNMTYGPLSNILWDPGLTELTYMQD